MEKLQREKKIARKFQERKHQDWNDNYELYRNKVRTNRLTQRQAVNLPLMKETVKTLLSKIDDPPIVEWQELSGDEQKEIIFQEVWNSDYEALNFEALDVQDKKTVLLYGRSFKKLNIVDNQISVNALDSFDCVVDPFTDPLNIESARFILHQNIFHSLRDILANKRYTEKGKEKLKIYKMSDEGIVQSSKNQEEWKKKLERLEAMGVMQDEFPLFAGGDVIVNLTEHYTNVWNAKTQKFERKVIVYADDTFELLNESLEELIGMSDYPFITWGEDIETTDFWLDSAGDLVRTPNKVLNVWFSQLVENRTLRNFQMHWYDATVQGYQPQTYEPGPGRMLPAPGDPNKTILPVNIQGLDETLTAIDFLIRMVERGTSATSIEKGVSEKKQITLGEVQLLVGKAMERTIAMAKFYRRSWEELAWKWYKMKNANPGKKFTLYKTSASGKLYPKVVYSSDWKSQAGYKPIVSSSSEHEEEQTKGIQKWMFVLPQFPNNQALRKIAQKRMLEILDLTPAELREVEEGEKQAQELPIMPGTPNVAQEAQLAQRVQQNAQELQQLAT
ncbi:MAG: hypothetical protein AABY15_00930 [Nanoarchaeota archaeon]